MSAMKDFFENPLTFLCCYAIISLCLQRKEVNYLGIKKGTKLTETPKDFMLRVRLDGQTLTQLDRCCEVKGLSRSEVVRQGIQEQYAKVEK